MTSDELKATVRGLEELSEVLTAATEEFRAHGFEWSLDYSSARSVVSWPSGSTRAGDAAGWGGVYLVRLGVRGREADGVLVVWDLLHELGHVLSGQSPIPPGVKLSDDIKKEQRRRELDAWLRAWMWFKDACELAERHRESFQARARSCLATYGVPGADLNLP